MKKIGIITLPLIDNYGGILQATALYKFLEVNNFEPILIQKKFYLPTWKRFATALLEKIPLQNIKNIRSKKFNRLIHKHFIDSHIKNKTEICYTTDDLLKIAKKYKFNSVITGSDQVWRWSYIDKKYYGNYFLDFIKDSSTMKISYAASFGLSGWEDDNTRNHVAKLISNLDAVSCREHSGVQACLSMGANHCEHVVDPTLLINPSFYLDIIDHSDSPVVGHRKTLLCYILDQTNHTPSFIKKIISTLGDNYDLKTIYSGGESFQSYSISDWLKFFKSADFILTDSFHGTVFSIIFKKQFIATTNSRRGADRFSSLLSKLELKNRLVSLDNPKEIEDALTSKINYDEVSKNLDPWIEESRNFLVHNLSKDLRYNTLE